MFGTIQAGGSGGEGPWGAARPSNVLSVRNHFGFSHLSPISTLSPSLQKKDLRYLA